MLPLLLARFSYFVLCMFFFFFNDTATTEIYTLSLHDALPILGAVSPAVNAAWRDNSRPGGGDGRNSSTFGPGRPKGRSEEHTSELQSHVNLVCRLLLEKKKKKRAIIFLSSVNDTNLSHMICAL